MKIKKPDYPIMFKTNIFKKTTEKMSISDYLLVNVVSGSGTMNVKGVDYLLGEGMVYLVDRFEKVQFQTKSSLRLLQVRILESMVGEYLLRNKPMAATDSCNGRVERIPHHLLVGSFFSSIEEAVNNEHQAPFPLVFLKMQECIGILTYVRPALYDWFSRKNSTHRIELREFMETHYKDNMPLEQLAMASGRSLSTFRRDFVREFGMTPGKWLMAERLKEAYRLITQCHKSPSAFLYDLGFESFPHFSRSFKSAYGIQPSLLLKMGSYGLYSF